MASKTQDSYDVLVVGSGASGGWAAKRLAEAGVKVALVDAGKPLRVTDLNEHGSFVELPYRERSAELVRKTRPIQKDCYACTERNFDWFANDLEEPYTTAEGKPFSWQGRMRVTGGRTVVWGRQSYRMGDIDLKAASHDGFGVDWPLAYADLEKYYDLVEDYVGISGLAEGVYELPDSRFHPAMPFNCAEKHLRERVKSKMGWTVTIGRVANITRSLNGRAPCHYCGPCYWGCVTNSYFNSAFTTVADALASGNCTHVPNAMVYKVLTDASNRATGLLYIDRVTREAKEIRGKTVVLCAQALETARILLNSKNERNPAGLGNSSGVLGHYLMDHLWVAGGAGAEFPGMEMKPSLDGPNRPNGIYVIRFRNTKKGPKSKDFLRGYGFQGGQGTGFSFDAPGFGADYKRAVKNPASSLRLVGFGECLPYFENYVEIDPSGQADAYGIPILKVNMGWGENERKMIPDMAVSAAEMMEAAGGKNIEPFAALDRVPGFGIHELGVARMGNDPKTSVLNQFQQAHDVKNLFVMDGAGFTSGACQNPTLTIMALTVRSSDYLLTEMKRGNL
ncbi:MAG TPA: GMC family oxidoreductase [Vicinamibacteria bacterium]